MMREARDAVEASDADLVADLRKGSHSSFTALMARHRVAVFRYAWALADQPRDVDDIVQEAFLVLWRRRHSINVRGSSALPWLLTTCRNVAMNRNRRERTRRAVPLGDVADSASRRAAERENAIRELQWVADEIARLDDLDRRLCQLCLIEGVSYERAAKQLGITQPAARKRIQRARARLAQARELEDFG